MSWYKVLQRGLFRPVLTMAFRPWVKGRDNLPATGAVIVAPNHCSYGETVLLPAVVNRQMSFPVKAELFASKNPMWRAIGWFLKSVGMVPLDRSGGRASATGLEPLMDVLAKGGVVGIFPEGTRSGDGRLYKGRTGVARMALQARAPIVPVGLVDTQFTKGRLGISWMRRPGVNIGRPIDVSQWYGRENETRVLREITDLIMCRIQELSGQEYVDVYSTKAKGGQLDKAQLDALVRPYPGAPKPESRASGAVDDPAMILEPTLPADQPGASNA